MLSANPWAIDQAPLPVDLSRQEYWYRLPLSPPGYFSTQRSNPCLLGLLHWQADALLLSHLGIACYGLALSKKMGLRIKARSSVNLTIEHKSQTQVSTHWEHSDHRKSKKRVRKAMAYEGYHMGGTRRSHLGARNVLELHLDGDHPAVYSIETHPAD